MVLIGREGGLKRPVTWSSFNEIHNKIISDLNKRYVNISRETLSKIENGNRTVSAMELNALCKVLNIDMNTLFKEYEDDDLVTLFRKKNFSEKTIKEVEKLQDMVREYFT
jgi:transcriptional regulator with XRE-family HTH domain